MKKTVPLILATILVLFSCASTPPSKDVVTITEGTYEGRDYIKIESSRYPNAYVRVYSLSNMPIHPNYERAYDNMVYIPDGYEYMDYTVDNTYNGSHSVYMTLKYDSLKDRRLREAPTSVPQEPVEKPTTTGSTDSASQTSRTFVDGGITFFRTGKNSFTTVVRDSGITMFLRNVVVPPSDPLAYTTLPKRTSIEEPHPLDSVLVCSPSEDGKTKDIVFLYMYANRNHNFDADGNVLITTGWVIPSWTYQNIVINDFDGTLQYSGIVNTPSAGSTDSHD